MTRGRRFIWSLVIAALIIASVFARLMMFRGGDFLELFLEPGSILLGLKASPMWVDMNHRAYELAALALAIDCLLYGAIIAAAWELIARLTNRRS
jgi:hypothetical protein